MSLRDPGRLAPAARRGSSAPRVAADAYPARSRALTNVPAETDAGSATAGCRPPPRRPDPRRDLRPLSSRSASRGVSRPPRAGRRRGRGQHVDRTAFIRTARRPAPARLGVRDLHEEAAR